MNLTRSNIAYDLTISPHLLEVPYENETLTYVFSSDLYKRLFYTKFIENREKIAASLSKRFNFNVQLDVLADVKLYTTIEKRGFLIRRGQENIRCQKDIIFVGGMRIQQPSREQ